MRLDILPDDLLDKAVAEAAAMAGRGQAPCTNFLHQASSMLISASNILGALADTLNKAINKIWFLTMGKIEIRGQGK